MTKRFLGYLILMVALYLILNYSGYDALMQVFFFLLLLPVISFAAVMVARYRLNFHFEIKQPQVQRGEPFTFHLHIHNPSFLPLSAVDVELSHLAESTTGGSRSIRFVLSAFSRESFPILYQFQHRGTMELRLEAVHIQDSCGFFRLPLSRSRLRQQTLVEVWPRRMLPESEAVSNIAEMEAEVSRTAKTSQELDEIARLRIYQPGDKLKLVHWSVSARMKDLHVREFEETRELETAVIVADALPSSRWAQELADAGGESALSIVIETVTHKLPTRLILAGSASNHDAQTVHLSGISGLDYASSAIARQIPETAVRALTADRRDRLDRGIRSREDLSDLIRRHLVADTRIVYLVVYAIDESLTGVLQRLMRRITKLYLVYISIEAEPDLSHYREALSTYNIVFVTVDARDFRLTESNEQDDKTGSRKRTEGGFR